MEWAGSHTSLNTAPSYSNPTDYEKVVLVSKSKIIEREDHSYCFLPFKTTRKKKRSLTLRTTNQKFYHTNGLRNPYVTKKTLNFDGYTYSCPFCKL